MQNVLPFFTASLRAGCWTQPPIQRGRPLANELARSSYDQWQSPTLQSLFEPLRATSFDLNPVEAGLFSTVSHSRLVIGALREKPTHRENNHPEIVAPPCLGQPREHLLLFALLLSLPSDRLPFILLSFLLLGASLFPLIHFALPRTTIVAIVLKER